MPSSFAPELDDREPIRVRGASTMVPAVQNRATSTGGTTTAFYEGGSHARRLSTWRPQSARPNDLLGSLTTLRDRSRQAVRNDGYGKSVIDKLVTNVIGTGITPLSRIADRTLREHATELFLRWTDESDADGVLDYYGQQAQSVRCWFEAGDCYIRRRDRLPSDGLTVPMQLQVLEPELCPHTYNGFAQGGNRIRAGIEFNQIGKRVAYYFHPSRPDLDDFDASQLRRVPAESVIALYDPLRAGQIRGIPILTPTLVRLHELDKMDDATLLRNELANLFAAFLKRDAPNDGSTPINPLTGQEYGSGDPPTLSLEPGIFQELDPGQEVQFSDPPAIQGGYLDFYRQQLRAVASSCGVPYEVLTGDMTGLNDRTARVLLNEFKRRMTMIQHQIVVFQLCRVTWRWWWDAAFLAGALPIPFDYLTDRAPYLAVKWMPQRWAYIQPVQDVESDIKAISAGLTSRTDVVAEYGEDAELIDEQQAEDNQRADDLGLKYTSDGRNALNGSPSATPADEPPDPAVPDDGEVTPPAAARIVRIEHVAPKATAMDFRFDEGGRVIGLDPAAP